MDTKEKEVFFACRKLWVKGKEEDQKEVIDEQTYDTSSTAVADIFPYLVTKGYETEDNRMEVSVEQLGKIMELRKKYGVNELSEAPWLPEWTFKCVTNKELEDQWPFHIQGADKDGRVVLWDKSGNIDLTWLREKTRDPEAIEAIKFYVVKQAENVLRTKIGVSQKMGHRMVKHVAVVDAKNVKITNLNKLKSLVGQILKDMQTMYPNTLKKLYVINAKWAFKAAWKVIKIFLHPITARKIEIVGTKYKPKLEAAGITDIPEWVA